MILSFAVIKRNYEGRRMVKSLFHARRGAGVLRCVMTIAEVQIPQINWQWHRRAQDPDRIVSINREITKQQDRAHRAAFPETDRNHAFARPLRSDPLNHKTDAEDNIAAPADDLPKPETERDAEQDRIAKQVKTLHNVANVETDRAA